MVLINSFRTLYTMILLCHFCLLQKLEPHEKIRCTDFDIGQRHASVVLDAIVKPYFSLSRS
jgi:hypothetical protein